MRKSRQKCVVQGKRTIQLILCPWYSKFVTSLPTTRTHERQHGNELIIVLKEDRFISNFCSLPSSTTKPHLHRKIPCWTGVFSWPLRWTLTHKHVFERRQFFHSILKSRYISYWFCMSDHRYIKTRYTTRFPSSRDLSEKRGVHHRERKVKPGRGGDKVSNLFLLWINEAKSKDKTYMSVGVLWWK